MSSEGQSSVVSLVQQVLRVCVSLQPSISAFCGVTPLQLKAGSITKEELFAKLSSLQVCAVLMLLFDTSHAEQSN
jgi:hypothetical protein